MSEHVVSAGPRVAVSSLTKTFPGTVALRDVDLEIRAGEIHALVGGNGSGKSTLIKILSGVYQGDPGGVVRIGDVVVDAESMTPEVARGAGVHVVHQDLGIFLDLSVAENMALGSEYDRHKVGAIDWRALNQRTRDLIKRFEIDARPSTLLRELSQGARTQVAIARALQLQGEDPGGLLILDEPTASLPEHEVSLLLDQLRRYASNGQAILYVSHRLDEIIAISDKVSALRDGVLVGTFDTSDLDENGLIQLILGKSLETTTLEKRPPGNVVLGADRVAVGPLREVSFDIREGEVVGIAGLLGSGRSELLRCIFGDIPARRGSLRLDGREFRPREAKDAIRAGIALVPENRVQEAAFLDHPIADNIAIPAISRYWRRGRISRRDIDRAGAAGMKKFLVKATNERAHLATLSGGNQQKVVLARWLSLRPRLLLLDEPTQGVDVGARSEIYQLIRRATTDGAAALVVASDFEELAQVCDRVLVLRRGELACELTGDDVNAHKITQMTHRIGDTE
ncbi:sugar ABC transporter ATP-binding protein [Amycolatopsis pithecellobii]|uniref:ATP-binding cassette domain-containing protein n=1 Tax=Amycolatopsis pithecellobii TaxID=664692 RepID=A0A6N7Z3S9_9PSEU|nr:sugar ABC transporter ATP-binding protein [Amycolatopsis pithecellobii]MTD54951.1 ATP-binding cassette domain-containing protein [Amycolatopsis pithecellobii]